MLYRTLAVTSAIALFLLTLPSDSRILCHTFETHHDFATT